MLRRTLVITAVAGLFCSVSSVSGQTITGISSVNESSDDPISENREFHSSIQVSEVTDLPRSSSFVHRVAFRNGHIGLGGVAQVNKRNAAFDLTFTVEDPDNNGFRLRIDEFMQGISEVQWDEGGAGTAFATGLSMRAQYDDSTDEADTFDLIGGLVGLGTGGVQINEPGAIAELHSRTEDAGLGPYFGTTTFTLRFSSRLTSTTNVVFPNNASGSGAVVYGFGSIPPGFDDVIPEDLGHFLTITAAFASPCPGDVTGDGMIDLADLNLVLANFGSESIDGDTNIDGVVDLADLNMVLALFGTSCG